jgi:hypothetical protein
MRPSRFGRSWDDRVESLAILDARLAAAGTTLVVRVMETGSPVIRKLSLAGPRWGDGDQSVSVGALPRNAWFP